MTAPNELCATDVVAATRSGELSAQDVAEAVLARVADRDPMVRAFAFIDPALVRAQARALDDASVHGPLHGVPVAVKDVINTKDMPTEHYSARYAGSRPGVDAACVDTLRAAGALLIGKTATTEFAATGVGGPARNPRDLSRTPGGSSSGSAAAVADLQSCLALGTQTGGSTIRPASYNAIFGWKPTWNSVSREGLKMFSATCDTLGFYSRSAADLALLADVFQLDPPDGRLPSDVAGARVGVCRSPAWDKAEPASRSALIRGADALSGAGARVVELELPDEFGLLPEAHRVILHREGRAAFLNEYATSPDLADSFIEMVENREGLTAASCRQAYALADHCRTSFDEVFTSVDVVLTPSATGEAPVGLESTGDASFNSLWTVLQVPVVNVPGLTGPAGMPVGLSLVGRRYDDRRVIAYARLAEAVLASVEGATGAVRSCAAKGGEQSAM